jgi:hypothetical protein
MKPFDENAVKKKHLTERQSPRFSVGLECFFDFSTQHVHRLLDLSREGCAFALLDEGSAEVYPVGAEVSGELQVAGERLSIRAQVKSVVRGRVGLSLTDGTLALGILLDRFQDPSYLGARLRPMPSNGNGELGLGIWYRGPGGAEALFQRGNDGQIHAFQLGSSMVWVEWTAVTGVRTGTFSLQNRPHRGSYQGLKDSLTPFLGKEFSEDANIHLQTIEFFRVLIKNSVLDSDLKNLIHRKFEE